MEYYKEKEMAKKIVLGLLVMAVIAAAASAQEASGSFGTVNAFGFGAKPMAVNQFSDQNARSNLKLFADGDSPGVWTDNPTLAGWINTLFGLWSWRNQDWLGGAVTVGLWVAGGTIFVASNYAPIWIGGLGMMIASPIYGFYRGLTECRKIQAANLAEAIGDNPLNNISVVVFPAADKKGAVGAFTYKLSF